MNKSTLVKIGMATAALATAKIAYSSWQGKQAAANSGFSASDPGNNEKSAGMPADEFSSGAVQHDLSIGEGA